MILASICARGGSKGVPRKNIRLLGGKPLIAHTIACAHSCAALDRVIVSTDDQEIAEVARNFGAEVPFLRPSHLAQDDSSKWHVFQHLVSEIERITSERVDVLVDLDIGVPLRLPSDITGCLEVLLNSQAEVAITAYDAERNPYFNMVEIESDGYAHIVKPLQEPVVARQGAPRVYSLSPAVYAIERDALWKYEHWSKALLQIYPMPRERAIDIDSEIDFQFAEFLMERKVGGGVL